MARGSKGPVIVAAIAIVAILFACAIIAGVTLMGGIDPGESQTAVAETFGPPAYFVLEYLPADDAEEGPLTRVESWYYPEHGQVVHFLAGVSVSIETLEPDDATYPYLDPRLFDFEMTAEQIVEALGEPAERIDDVVAPVSDGDAATESGEVYVSEHALFGVQDGMLLYLETFGDAGPQGGE